jgi:hypothetical protein
MGTTPGFDDTIALVPSPRGAFEQETTSLARSQRGKLYRKQILKKGTYPHPADPSKPLVIDDGLIDSLVTNFNAEVCDIVQVPVADDSNRHVEDPLRNIGEVSGWEKSDDGLYGLIDVRDESAAPKLGRTLLGTSAMMHLNYTDTRSGRRVGPTLLHTLVTNRPYITGMEGYEEVVAASADTQGNEAVVFATREEDTQMPDRDELIAALRDEHQIDVEALQTQVTELSARPDPDAFGRQVLEVVKAAGAELPTKAKKDGENDDEDGEFGIRDVAEAVIELAHEHRESQTALQEMRAEREAAKQRETEREVTDLITAGRVLPSQKDAMVKLAREDRETFDAIVPANPIVDLAEHGTDTSEMPDIEEFNAEVARLSEMADTERGVTK